MPDPENRDGTGNTDEQPQQTASVSLSEAKKYQETTAAKFYTSDSSLQAALDKIDELMKAPVERHGANMYLRFGDDKNDEFKKILRELNRYVAEAEVLFDSDIKLEKSSPDFRLYRNLLQQLYENCITIPSNTYFFQVNARENRYLYSFRILSLGFGKISVIIGEIQGKLRKSGQYIEDEPLTKSPSSQGQGIGGQYYGGGGYGGYGGGYGHNNGFDPYSPHLGDDLRIPQDKRKPLRQIGDALDGVQ